MKTVYFISGVIVMLFWLSCKKTPAGYVQEVEQFRKDKNLEFINPEKSPLEKEEIKNFKGLNYYPVDYSYRIEAKFIRTPDQPVFEMKTTTERTPLYRKYGEAHFRLQGKKCKLDLFQSMEHLNHPEYGKYLFVPFRDKTTGKETYGGGRFLDVLIPEGDIIILDFNYAYNPYCAYNHRYSCPIPPPQNTLDVEITAGEKNYKDHNHD